MKRLLLHILVIWSLAAALAWPALYAAAALADLGLFGTCAEGNCAWGALIIGFPLIWMVLTATAAALYLRWFRARW